MCVYVYIYWLLPAVVRYITLIKLIELRANLAQSSFSPPYKMKLKITSFQFDFLFFFIELTCLVPEAGGEIPSVAHVIVRLVKGLIPIAIRPMENATAR